MWMQLQQQINQQRTTSGDIIGSQVTLNPFFVASFIPPSFFLSTLLPFLPSIIFHPLFATLRPFSYFFSSLLDTASNPRV
jgi:hypothetical protein